MGWKKRNASEPWGSTLAEKAIVLQEWGWRHGVRLCGSVQVQAGVGPPNSEGWCQQRAMTFTCHQGTAEMGGGVSEPRGWYSTHPSLAAKAGVVRPASQQG